MQLMLVLGVILTLASADAYAFGRRNKCCNVVQNNTCVASSQVPNCTTCGVNQQTHSCVVISGGYNYVIPVTQTNYPPLVVSGCPNGSCKIR